MILCRCGFAYETIGACGTTLSGGCFDGHVRTVPRED